MSVKLSVVRQQPTVADAIEALSKFPGNAPLFGIGGNQILDRIAFQGAFDDGECQNVCICLWPNDVDGPILGEIPLTPE